MFAFAHLVCPKTITRSEFIHSPKGVRSFTQTYRSFQSLRISLPSLERIKLRIQPKGFTQTLDHDCYMIGSLNVLDIVCYIQEAYRSQFVRSFTTFSRLSLPEFAQSAHSLYRSLKLQVDAHSLIMFKYRSLCYLFVHVVHSYKAHLDVSLTLT